MSLSKPNPLKIALVHDWLVSQRGGENVLDALCELYPNAELFTLVHAPGQTSPRIEKMKKRLSVLNRIPRAEKFYRHCLPLMPTVIESFDLSEFDLIISSSHCVAKGVKKRKDATHICYIHAPMRYMWDRFDEYFSKDRAGLITRTAARAFRPYLKAWDKKSATRVDHFIANSHFIAEKVKAYYGREAQVVHPFCEWQNFSRGKKVSDRYLIVTALVPYKRVDLAIEAFNQLNRPLLIVGDGPERARLEKRAGPNITFAGSLKAEELAQTYAESKALIFPGIEDFGIVPLEAMAAGLPVIAFGQGGALETVTSETGVFFRELTVESLVGAVQELDVRAIDSEKCRARARKFSREKFLSEMKTLIEKAISC